MSKARPGIVKNPSSAEGPLRTRRAMAQAWAPWVGLWLVLGMTAGFVSPAQALGPLILEGVHAVPHIQSTNLLYLRSTNIRLGARVQLFIRNAGPQELTLDSDTFIRFRSLSPEQLVAAEEWAWHDLPTAWPQRPLVLPPGAMTVWSFNGRESEWGINTSSEVAVSSLEQKFPSSNFGFRVDDPKVWISSVTFLGPDPSPTPQSAVVHIANQDLHAIRMKAVRLWTPKSTDTWRSLWPGTWMESPTSLPSDGVIAAGDRGVLQWATGPLPLSYAAVEVRYEDSERQTRTLWAHLRVKREAFALSGGWVESKIQGRSTLTDEPFLKTLHRMHLDTAHIGQVPGYTDNDSLYPRYPLHLFHKLDPIPVYDTDAWLPRIHAVEFLGEPQYGGGKPVAPMEVWKALAPYQSSRLPTTVTHSEERIWRQYAGLSDYPHFDAYRISAPAADTWARYTRWGGPRIRWGAPLETIGNLTRSLRELSRPTPIAYWSQGAHVGWEEMGGRKRTSPTPDELRAQAYHALSARITSLYWFNLNIESLVQFPDLIEPITEVNRHIRVLQDYFLEGDGYHYRRVNATNGAPLWDVSVIASPRGALLFALDLAYQPDHELRQFKFAGPRQAAQEFPLPRYLREPVEVVEVTPTAARGVSFVSTATGVQVTGSMGPFSVFVVSPKTGATQQLQKRLEDLKARERSFQFDPGNKPEDLQVLKRIVAK